MRVLVTGATGFIGSHVVEALLSAGHEPVAAVRPTSNLSLLDRLGVPRVLADVTDRAALREACRGMDCVVHTAAIVATYGAWEPYRRVGVQGTANVVDAAIAAGVPRLVHASSIAVHGLQRAPGRIIREESPIAENAEWWNNYVREKVLSERVVWRAHESGEIAVTSLRPAVVLGARDRATVPRMAKFADSPWGGVIGNGKNRVAWVAADDLARLAVLAAKRPEAIGRAYVASSPQIVTQRQIVDAFTKAFGRRPKPWRVPYAVAMMSGAVLDEAYASLGVRTEPMISRFSVGILGNDFRADASRARRELGWIAETDLATAVQSSVDAFRASQDGQTS